MRASEDFKSFVLVVFGRLWQEMHLWVNFALKWPNDPSNQLLAASCAWLNVLAFNTVFIGIVESKGELKITFYIHVCWAVPSAPSALLGRCLFTYTSFRRVNCHLQQLLISDLAPPFHPSLSEAVRLASTAQTVTITNGVAEWAVLNLNWMN